MSRALNGLAENGIVSCTAYNEASPSAIQLGAIAYTKSFTIGVVPSTWSAIAGLSPAGGTLIPQGTSHNERTGKFVYLQHTRVTMSIDMLNNADNCVPVEFRCLVIKSRRGVTPVGVSTSFSTSLFLGTNGDEFGHATGGINGTDLMVQPINKKDWYVFSDRKFMLSNPQVQQDPALGSTTVYSGKYPCFKRMTYKLPYNSRVELSALTDLPVDLDCNYVMLIYSRSLGKDEVANKYEVNFRGSTSFKDI